MTGLRHLPQNNGRATARSATLVGAAAPGDAFANAVTDAPLWQKLVTAAGTAIGAYHGYARDRSVGWALVWGVAGFCAPFVTVPIALVQGLGTRK